MSNQLNLTRHSRIYIKYFFDAVALFCLGLPTSMIYLRLLFYFLTFLLIIYTSNKVTIGTSLVTLLLVVWLYSSPRPHFLLFLIGIVCISVSSLFYSPDIVNPFSAFGQIFLSHSLLKSFQLAVIQKNNINTASVVIPI